MYDDVAVYWLHAGVLQYLRHVTCGVLQGCPISTILFNFSVDPLLFMFSEYIVVPSLGHVLACADDFGAVLYRLQSLVYMYHIFNLYGKVSGLKLHPDKCV